MNRKHTIANYLDSLQHPFKDNYRHPVRVGWYVVNIDNGKYYLSYFNGSTFSAYLYDIDTIFLDHSICRNAPKSRGYAIYWIGMKEYSEYVIKNTPLTFSELDN